MVPDCENYRKSYADSFVRDWLEVAWYARKWGLTNVCWVACDRLGVICRIKLHKKEPITCLSVIAFSSFPRWKPDNYCLFAEYTFDRNTRNCGFRLLPVSNARRRGPRNRKTVTRNVGRIITENGTEYVCGARAVKFKKKLKIKLSSRFVIIILRSRVIYHPGSSRRFDPLPGAADRDRCEPMRISRSSKSNDNRYRDHAHDATSERVFFLSGPFEITSARAAGRQRWFSQGQSAENDLLASRFSRIWSATWSARITVRQSA